MTEWQGLVALSIQNVVLIDRLDMELQPGLCALTGETGAGKSVLLDSLGLALGARAEAALVREGTEQAMVTAQFDLPSEHPALERAQDQGLSIEGTLILRRTISIDGRSRAFINDQPVSLALLKDIGALLVEVHGQFAAQGLLDPSTHGRLLDAFGGLQDQAAKVRAAWSAWREGDKAREALAQALAQARQEEGWLRASLNELDEINPQADEAQSLSERRNLLQSSGRILEAVATARDMLEGSQGAERQLVAAQRALARAAEKAPAVLAPALAALDRAMIETRETLDALDALDRTDEFDPLGLERIEERLFTLRALARKHGVEVEGLAGLRRQFAQRLGLIENDDDTLSGVAAKVQLLRTEYVKAAERLSASRAKAAAELEKAVSKELTPLKLGKARFGVNLVTLDEAEMGPGGAERVQFIAATNPGVAPAPLNKIASGGELARFMLALRAVLSAAGGVPVLVFDEIDVGVSGAVADAVGERLALLATRVQVLAVTHSPQVAARARDHLRVDKVMQKGRALTRITRLDDDSRREEIARLLSGAEVTDAARAAADSLLSAAVEAA
ncbi:MAG: DNA repair protein RecN [Alphaproteobacteria bacterium]|nr:MAG: DNA repair protein RecN [Alphaproteobacteria bacterium]